MPPEVAARLRALFDVTLNDDDIPLTQAELVGAMQTADGILGTVTDRFDAETIAAGGRRRAQIVATFAVGYNNIDVAAAAREGLVVTNTPDVLTDATADIALLLMLAATRRAWEFETMLRRGEWTGFGPTSFLGTGVQGKTVGIIGMGRIGKAMAQRCHVLGMRVIYYNRSPVADPGVPGAVARDSIDAVMAEADVVSLHMPGGAANRKVISAERLALMKPTAFLINSARGDVVDEEALVEMLANRRIAGAGLDVFFDEPKVPAALLALDNVTLLPHLGSATIETRTAMGMLAVDNLEAHFAGKPYPSRVA
jgi:lactate dehydrogenase-like 2-hydroxyacid dehydrogenase